MPDCKRVPAEGFTLCKKHNEEAQAAKPYGAVPEGGPPPNRPSGDDE